MQLALVGTLVIWTDDCCALGLVGTQIAWTKEHAQLASSRSNFSLVLRAAEGLLNINRYVQLIPVGAQAIRTEDRCAHVFVGTQVGWTGE